MTTTPRSSNVAHSRSQAPVERSRLLCRAERARGPDGRRSGYASGAALRRARGADRRLRRRASIRRCCDGIDPPMTDVTSTFGVRHNKAAHRFEVVVDGELARADYRIDGGVMQMFHTEVPVAFEGRGIAA